jgi:predicted DNA-binding transcriptional regulator YafY
MPRSENQKVKALVLMDILRNYSDEEHPLSTNQIIEKLSEVGIETARKALYDDIKTLNEFGYEVLTVKSRANYYYVVDRKFDAAELKILLDAVQSSDFITEKKTKELTEKIAAMAGAYKAKLLTKSIVFSDTVKHSNETVYYSVDTIDRAVIAKKKIEFLYFDLDCHGQRVYRKNKEKYIVNPVALVFNDNKYYLACYNDKYRNISDYRIDRMDKVEMTDDDITPSDCAADFNVNKHRKQAFSMYTGETQNVTFTVDGHILDVIFDKFGEKTKFCYIDGKKDFFKFSANIEVSPMFYGWCAGLGTGLKIIAPESVRVGYENFLEKIIAQYTAPSVG